MSIEQAREFLAAEYDKAGEKEFADNARKGVYDNDIEMRAIVAALAPKPKAPASTVLDGWSFNTFNGSDSIAICAPNADPGAKIINPGGRLEQRLLYALARDLLAVTKKPERAR